MPSQAPKYVPNPVPANPEDLPRYKQLLGNGSNIGMKFSFI